MKKNEPDSNDLIITASDLTNIKFTHMVLSNDKTGQAWYLKYNEEKDEWEGQEI